MIIEKLMMPYILASLHPIMHLTCAVTQIIIRYMLMEDTDELTCVPKKDINNCVKLTTVGNIIMTTHFGCALLHGLKYLINIFYLKNYEENKKKDNIFNSPYLIEILSVLKIALYFISIIYVQAKVSTDY